MQVGNKRLYTELCDDADLSGDIESCKQFKSYNFKNGHYVTYKDNVCVSQETYKDNMLHGECIYYDDDIVVVSNYISGFKHGKEFHSLRNNDPVQNTIFKINIYKYGLLLISSDIACNYFNGKSIIYYPNCNVKSVLNFVNGNMNGAQYEYNINGKLSYKINYFNGLVHGTQTEYDENEEIKSITYYSYNVPKVKVHYKNGEVIKFEHF